MPVEKQEVPHTLCTFRAVWMGIWAPNIELIIDDGSWRGREKRDDAPEVAQLFREASVAIFANIFTEPSILLVPCSATCLKIPSDDVDRTNHEVSTTSVRGLVVLAEV